MRGCVASHRRLRTGAVSTADGTHPWRGTDGWATVRAMRSLDVRAHEIGRTQLGFARRSQLRAAGIDYRVIARRRAEGTWTEPHPGVIDLGTHPPSWERDVLALVLATGEHAWASHRTAAYLYRMLDISRPRRTDVTILRGRSHQTDGIELHSTVRLEPDERGTVGATPVTSRLRTVVDLACDLDQEHLELLVADEVRGRPNAARHLERIAGRRPGWPGSPRVVAILRALGGGIGDVESFMEARGLKRFRDAGIPDPEVQPDISDGHGRHVARVDLLWRAAMLIVEFIGRRWHETPTRRQADAIRRRRLEALGHRVLEVYWEDLDGAGFDALVAEIRAHLLRHTGS